MKSWQNKSDQQKKWQEEEKSIIRSYQLIFLSVKSEKKHSCTNEANNKQLEFDEIETRLSRQQELSEIADSLTKQGFSPVRSEEWDLAFKRLAKERNIQIETIERVKAGDQEIAGVTQLRKDNETGQRICRGF